jgi:putative endonuclease
VTLIAHRKKLHKREAFFMPKRIDMVCTTYILYSVQLDRYYVGFTCEEVTERLQKHLQNHSGFTGKAKDWTIVHAEEFNTKEEAHARELQIKKWKSRKMIEALIGSD